MSVALEITHHATYIDSANCKWVPSFEYTDSTINFSRLVDVIQKATQIEKTGYASVKVVINCSKLVDGSCTQLFCKQ